MFLSLFYCSYLRWLGTSETWRLLSIPERALLTQLLFESISWRTPPGVPAGGQTVHLRPFEIGTNCQYLAEVCGVPWPAVEAMLETLAEEGLFVYHLAAPSVLITMVDLRDSLPDGVLQAVEDYRAGRRAEDAVPAAVIDIAAERRRRGLRG